MTKDAGRGEVRPNVERMVNVLKGHTGRSFGVELQDCRCGCAKRLDAIVDEVKRLRDIEEAAKMAFESIARMGQDVGADKVWKRHEMSRTYNRLREALEPTND